MRFGEARDGPCPATINGRDTAASDDRSRKYPCEYVVPGVGSALRTRETCLENPEGNKVPRSSFILSFLRTTDCKTTNLWRSLK